MDLAALIRACRTRPGNSLRAMEQRTREAVDRGELDQPLTRSVISDYEHGRIAGRPGRERVAGLAAALDCTFDEVAAAVEHTYRLAETSSAEPWYVTRWKALTEGRSDAEREELLLIAEQVLRMRDLDDPSGGAQGGP